MSVWDRFFTVLSHFYRVKIFWRLWWREAMPEWSNHTFIYSFIYFSPFIIMFSHIFHCAVKVLVTLHLAPLPLLVIYTAGSYTYILYMCITVCTHTFVISMSSLYNHISTYTLILLYVCMCMYVCVLFLCICVYV